MNITPVAHKISKARTKGHKPVRNNHGLTIIQWGYCIEQDLVSYVVVERELRDSYKGQWVQVSLQEEREGAILNLTPGMLEDIKTGRRPQNELR